MRRLSTFVFGAVAGGALVYTSLHFHLVRATDGIHLIRKTETRLAETYVDIRDFRPRDWLNHPRIAQAILQADREDLMRSAADQSLLNGLDNLLGTEGDR